MFPTTGGGTQITRNDPMSNAFAPIYSMIGGRGGGGGTQVTGGGSGPFGLQPQGMQGNDLTQMQRSLTNLLGTTGGQLGQLGQNVLGAGMQGAQQGFGTMEQGLQTLQDPLSYWQAILSGDPTKTAAALGPTATNLSQIFSGATNQAAQGMPGGGYRAATLAGLPQVQASQLGNALLQLQPTAATQLGTLGQEQAQIGSGMGQLGTAIGGLGTQLTGQGLQGLNDAINAVLQKMNLNIQEPSVFQNIMKAIGTVGGLATGIGNLGFKPFGGGGSVPGGYVSATTAPGGGF
jgi:hypothetical protein